jgi:hypothetical protein
MKREEGDEVPPNLNESSPNGRSFIQGNPSTFNSPNGVPTAGLGGPLTAILSPFHINTPLNLQLSSPPSDSRPSAIGNIGNMLNISLFGNEENQDAQRPTPSAISHSPLEPYYAPMTSLFPTILRPGDILRMRTTLTEMTIDDNPIIHRRRHPVGLIGGHRAARTARRRRHAEEDDQNVDTSVYRFRCVLDGRYFRTGQALGGHMSRKHPGKSEDYAKKKDIRRKREFERVKLRLAKKKFFTTIQYDYDDLMRTTQGKVRASRLTNRAKIKTIKANLTKKEIDDYIDSIDNNQLN